MKVSVLVCNFVNLISYIVCKYLVGDLGLELNRSAFTAIMMADLSGYAHGIRTKCRTSKKVSLFEFEGHKWRRCPSYIEIPKMIQQLLM